MMKGKVTPFYDLMIELGVPIWQLYQKITSLRKENYEIKDKAAALLHLPFSATEAFEKARKELLEVITKR